MRSFIKRERGISLIFICLLLLLGFGSCQKESTSPTTTEYDYNEIGRLHNEGLDAVLNELIENNLPKTKSGQKIDREQFLKEGKELCLKFLASKDVSMSPMSKSSFMDADSMYLNKSIKDYTELSEIQRTMFTKMENIVSGSFKFSEQMELFEKLEAEILLLPEAEHETLLSVSSIAKHSLEYWYYKLSKWQGKFIGLNRHPIINQNQVATKGPCPLCDPEGYSILLPNPNDCSSFFLHDYGYCDWILIQCDNGLWYNPKTGICDYPNEIEPGSCTPPNDGSAWYKNFAGADLAGAAVGATVGWLGGPGGAGAGALTGGLGSSFVYGASTLF